MQTEIDNIADEYGVDLTEQDEEEEDVVIEDDIEKIMNVRSNNDDDWNYGEDEEDQY